MSRFVSMLAMALFLGAACGNAQSSATDMLSPDEGPPVSPTPTLELPVGCDVSQTVPLTSFYYGLINNPSNGGTKCSSTSACHAGGGQVPIFGPDIATFRSAVINVSANRHQQPTLMYVKPNDPDNSFLLYKILGQQMKIQFGNAPMPLEMRLPGADVCLLINWVRTGAN